MSVKTTRRGLFTLAAALVAVPAVTAAAPRPELELSKWPNYVPAWQGRYIDIVVHELLLQGLDVNVDVQFDYDPSLVKDTITVTVREDQVAYSKVWVDEELSGDPEEQEHLARMQAVAVARTVQHHRGMYV